MIRRNKKDKEPKQPKHPMSRSMHGQNLKVTFKMIDDDHYETTEYWTGLNGQSLMAMGYIPAVDYKSEFKHLFTNVYVKFEGFEIYPRIRVGADGKEHEVETLETSSTLYDYFVSRAEQDFMASMKVKAMSSMSSKSLLFWGVIAAGVILAGYLFAHGGL